MRLLFCILFCFFIFILPSSAHSDDSNREAFIRAGRLYGSGDFNGALAEYEALMDKVSSAEVCYNAACAAIKSGRRGMALAFLQRAYDIKPGDPAIRSLRSSLCESLEEEGCVLMRPSELPFLEGFTENAIALCFFVSVFFICSAALINRFLKKDFFWIYAALGTAVCITGLSLAVVLTRFSGDYAVISSPTAEVRESQTTDSQCFSVLKDGCEVRLLAQENGWMRIAFETRDGRYFEGWIPEKDAVRI